MLVFPGWVQYVGVVVWDVGRYGTHSISLLTDHVVLLVWIRPLSIWRSLHRRTIHMFNIEALIRTAVRRRSNSDPELGESALEVVLFGTKVTQLAPMACDFSVSPSAELLD